MTESMTNPIVADFFLLKLVLLGFEPPLEDLLGLLATALNIKELDSQITRSLETLDLDT